MRCLGLDLGSKTLGIAISDKTNVIASVYTTLYFKNEDYESLLFPLNCLFSSSGFFGALILAKSKIAMMTLKL